MLEGTRAEKGREKEEQTVEEEKVAYRKIIIKFYDWNERVQKSCFLLELK